MRALIAAVAIFCAGLFIAAQAQDTCIGCGVYGMFKPSGGGSLTWAGTDAEHNNSCGFPSNGLCSVTVITAAGLVIAAISTVGPSAVNTAVSLCSTSLSKQIDTGIYNSQEQMQIWSGVVSCSGSQTLQITGQASGINNFQVALGTLTNYTSATPTTTCSNTSTNTGTTLSCSAALTVPSSGIAIAGGFEASNSTLNFSNMTRDELNSTAYAIEIGHNTTAGSLTPQMSNMGTGSSAAIVGATWH